MMTAPPHLIVFLLYFIGFAVFLVEGKEFSSLTAPGSRVDFVFVV